MSMMLSALGLLLPAPAIDGNGWVCRAHRWQAPHRDFRLEAVLLSDRRIRDLGFFVSWSARRGHAATQQYRWSAIPAQAGSLSPPDGIFLAVTAPRRARIGYTVRLDWPDGTELLTGRSAGVKRGGRLFPKDIFLDITRKDLTAPLWKVEGWRAQVADPGKLPMATLATDMPAEPEIQKTYAEMRAEIDRNAADPDKLCEKIREPSEDEII
jgi:hypothetical protein